MAFAAEVLAAVLAIEQTGAAAADHDHTPFSRGREIAHDRRFRPAASGAAFAGGDGDGAAFRPGPSIGMPAEKDQKNGGEQEENASYDSSEHWVWGMSEESSHEHQQQNSPADHPDHVISPATRRVLDRQCYAALPVPVGNASQLQYPCWSSKRGADSQISIRGIRRGIRRGAFGDSLHIYLR